MARWTRGTRLSGLRCLSDAGAQVTGLRYAERLAEIGASPSIGTVGDKSGSPTSSRGRGTAVRPIGSPP